MDHPSSGGWFLGGPWRWSFWSSQPGSLCTAHGIGTEGGIDWIYDMDMRYEWLNDDRYTYFIYIIISIDMKNMIYTYIIYINIYIYITSMMGMCQINHIDLLIHDPAVALLFLWFHRRCDTSRRRWILERPWHRPKPWQILEAKDGVHIESNTRISGMNWFPLTSLIQERNGQSKWSGGLRVKKFELFERV